MTINTTPLDKTQLLVFTDLDATLLDHNTYSFAPAKPMLDWLERHNIPVIPTTSKTSAELAELRVRLNNRHPFISENGACIWIPKDYFDKQPQGTQLSNCREFWIKDWNTDSTSSSRKHYQQLIQQACGELDFRQGLDVDTFESLGNKGIAKVTGLSVEQASLANKRQSSEPVYFHAQDSAQNNEHRKALADSLRALGVGVVEGGRFLHVMAPGTSKGAALKWLSQIYGYQHCSTIALGDSQNDVDMLERADYSVLIRNPHKAFPELAKSENVVRSESTGPKGWSEALCSILKIDLI